MKLARRCAAVGAGWACGLVFLVCAGCDREGVQAYTTPKEQAAAPVAAAPLESAAPAAEQVKVVWSAPAAWTEVSSGQATRAATYSAGGVEVAVTAFPGDAGGVLANVNRWRGQMGLAPATDAELGGMLATSLEGETRVATLEIVGADGKTMLGAIVSPGDGQTWFVKATLADADAARALRGEFDGFARSFRLGGAAVTAADPMMGAGTVAKHDDGSIVTRLASWEAPTNWVKDEAAGGIAAAVYNATNDGGGAKVTVTSLKGDGGGALANINRWRGQLGLEAWTELPAAGSGVSDLGGGAVMVDIVNAAGTDRMMAAVVPAPDGGGGESTWFFKARGAPAGIEGERGAFEAMVRAVGVGN